MIFSLDACWQNFEVMRLNVYSPRQLAGAFGLETRTCEDLDCHLSLWGGTRYNRWGP